MFQHNTFAQEQLEEGLRRWPKTLSKCHERASLFQKLQKEATTKDLEVFDELSTYIKTLEPLLRESTKTEKEGYSQVCFTGNPWSGLNSIPFALTIFSFYKSYIVPSFSLLLPLLTVFLPYVFLKFIYGIPIPFSDYTAILWRLWNGQGLPKSEYDLLHPAPQPNIDIATRLKQLTQNGWTLFTIGQSMWQPIQQARHFRRLDAECLSLGETLLRVKGIGIQASERWKRYLPEWFPDWVQRCPGTSRQAFAYCMDDPLWLQQLLRCLGRLEVLLRFACLEGTVPCSFISSSKPKLLLHNFGDPAIPLERRVLSSFSLGGKKGNHSLVTGPNRGGKSSFMRAVLMNVKYAHAFGFCIAGKAEMTPFTWIADGLRLADEPGKESMFEREVAFASGVLKKEKESKGFGLVLYDELFHSTNPPDGERTSRAFCSSLWKTTRCLSVLSTHVYALARDAPEEVQKVCLASWKLGPFSYKFSYKVQKGICEVSSVDLLLHKFGLSAAKEIQTNPCVRPE